MAFLTINGLTIPTLKGGQVSPTIIGESERAFDGTLLSERRAEKRVWKFATPSLKRYDAEAVRGLLKGFGYGFAFDGSLRSSSGIGPKASPAAVVTYHNAVAADGYPADGEAKFGASSLAVEPATTNLLSGDSRNAENAPTGYVALLSAALTGNTVHKWQGSRSVRCVCSGSGSFDGLRTDYCDPGAGSATKTYRGSVYVKSPTAGLQLCLSLYDGTNVVFGTIRTVTLTSANTWYRFFCDITIGGADCRSMSMTVAEANDTDNPTFYCDGFQIEQQSLGVTSWVDGARAAGALQYPALLSQAKAGFTVNLWAKLQSPQHATDRYLFKCVSGSSLASIYRAAVSDNVAFELNNGSYGVLATTALVADTWRMFTLVARRNPESGEYHFQAFHNGSLFSSGTLTGGAPDFSSLTPTIYVGNNGSAGYEFGAGLIDDLLVLPYPVTATMLAGWYSTSVSQAGTPILTVAGDGIDDPSVLCRGFIEQEQFMGLVDSTTWRNNMRRISFRLEEI